MTITLVFDRSVRNLGADGRLQVADAIYGRLAHLQQDEKLEA